MSTRFRQIFEGGRPIIGMIALPPLAGRAGFPGLPVMLDRALADLQTLEQGGVDAVCVENDFDRPHQLTIDGVAADCFTAVTREVCRHASIPVGLQVLLNDWRRSLTIAKATGARFVRLDHFVDRVRISTGIVEPEPEAVIAHRKDLAAEGVALLADVQVKHSTLLETGKTLAMSARQAIAHGADALIVTGKVTGDPPTESDLHEVRAVSGDSPVLIGSGATAGNIGRLLAIADGAIVGTALRRAQAPQEPVVLDRVRDLVVAARAVHPAC